MATLENIRQKKNILAIVIGGALLAFIIEVGIEALGRQIGNSDIAKVGSEKIDIMTFQHRVEQASQAEQNNPNQTDPAVRQQEVLEDMINEILLDKEYDATGIGVSNNELSEWMIGDKALPQMQQFAQQMGMESPKQLYELITNPDKFGASRDQVNQLKILWNQQQEQLVDQLKFVKLQNLLAGTIKANDLDRAQMAEDAAVTDYITFVKKDYNSVPSESFDKAITDKELRAEYNKRKPLFAIDEELRAIHYIAVNVTPSEADIAAANAIADRAYAALQRGHGIDSVRVMGTVAADSIVTTLAEAKGDVKDFLTAAAVGEVKRPEAQGNHHVMYKLMSKNVSLDSVNIALVMVPGNKATQDSVLNELKAGKTVADLQASVKGIQEQPAQWLRVAAFADSIKNRIAAAGADYFVLAPQAEGATIAKVVEKKAPKTFYTYGEVTYDAYASQDTQDAARARLQDYLNKNKNAKDFEEHAAKAGLNATAAEVTPSTPQLGMNPYTRSGIKDSRKAIKWAFENKVGAVSPIFSDNKDVLVAVAIDDVYSGDYLPLSHKGLHDYLNNLAINTLKGDSLVQAYKGKASDLNGYAKLMGASVDTTQVVFAQDNIAKIGNEPALVGIIATAKPGTVVGPIKGENGVYVFKVDKQEKAAEAPSKEDLDQRFAQTRGNVANPNMITRILAKGTKVKKNIEKFF